VAFGSQQDERIRVQLEVGAYLRNPPVGISRDAGCSEFGSDAPSSQGSGLFAIHGGITAVNKTRFGSRATALCGTHRAAARTNESATSDGVRVTGRVHSLMVVHERDGVAGPGFDDGVVEDLAQVVRRTALARLVEVVVQRHVEERGLSKNKRGRQLDRGTREGERRRVSRRSHALIRQMPGCTAESGSRCDTKAPPSRNACM
jgi:hypothetical protein